MGMILVIQIVRGVLMACHYTPSVDLAYSSVVHINRDVHGGWLVRSLHSNGASFFFGCAYGHMGRGLYYHSFYLWKVWSLGVTIYIVLIGISFLGYVLPWGQISF